MLDHLEEIRHGHDTLALIIYRNFAAPGVLFLTPGHSSQQLAYMNHPAGRVIQPHVHHPVRREVRYTQEVLFIKKGRLRVDFYSPSRKYLESRALAEGDIILLASGGHGFEVLEDLEMVEVKQGPYAGEADKARFEAVPVGRVRLPA
jgi:mannose-6-phosphate isomerase-like protein (cupin superfamily)